MTSPSALMLIKIDFAHVCGRISCTRTKREAIATNVLSPIGNNKLSTELCEAMFVAVSADEGNKKAMKLTPILVKCFNSMKSVKIKPLDSIKREASKIITDFLQFSI
jgi:hypothetical protein